MVEGILGHVVEDAGVGLEVALTVEVTAGEVVVISRIAEAGVEGGEGVITVRVIRATIIRPPSRIQAGRPMPYSPMGQVPLVQPARVSLLPAVM